jgi:anaerobic selenocysteine-containing dehydrogenase
MSTDTAPAASGDGLVQTHRTYCRICTAYCGLAVDVADERIVGLRGDPKDPLSGGYTCIKGRQLAHQQAGPNRLRGALKRCADGSLESIESRRAVAEIGDRLASILAEYGPRAIGSYSGTAAYSNSGVLPLIRAWHKGIGSCSNYSSLTIDQPSKIAAVARQGVWGAGPHSFASADVIMSIGNNPLVSGLTLPGGIPGTNPFKTFEDARRRGLKVICVDPRRSEVARRSDIHLQLRPGEDTTLLAGMLHIILAEKLHDREFCDEYSEGLAELTDALADFTPDYVEQRSSVPREQLLEATRLFAAGPRGCVSSGTGPDMGPHPSLNEHLISCINGICGRYNREGEVIPNPGVLGAPLPRPAQVIAPELLPPTLQLNGPDKSRFRNLSRMFDEMPTTTLADEILTPGKEQIRALIVTGGNPAVAVPDSARMVEALESLDLLVTIDISLTETAKRSDYVLAARHSLEREDLTEFMDLFYEVPYAHFTQAVVDPGFDTLEDWEPFVAWADRLGGKIELAGGEVPLGEPLSKLDLLKLNLPATRVPLEEIRAAIGGKVFEEVAAVAAPPIPGLEAKLQLAPTGACDELRDVRAEDFLEARARFSHLLICRRMKMVLNSVGQDFPDSQKQAGTNPAWMNENDVAMLGLEAGDLIEIESEVDRILAVVAATNEVEPGVISMAHCWGRPDGGKAGAKSGSNTAQLLSPEREWDPITGMARMTAVPVNVRPADV